MESHISESQIDDSVNKVMQSIQNASGSINKLREEIVALQETRAMSIIHLSQFKNDYDALFEMYRKYKDILQNGLPIYKPPTIQNNMMLCPPGQQQQIVQQQQMVQQKTGYYNDQGNSKILGYQQISSQPLTPMTNIMQMQNIMQPPPPPPQMAAPIPPQTIIEPVKEEKTVPAPATPKKNEEEVSFSNTQYDVIAKTPTYDSRRIRLKYSLSTNAVVCSVAFNSNGTKFVFANSKFAFVINYATGKVETQINMRTEQSTNEFNPRCVRFTPDDKYVVLGNDDCNLVVFDSTTGEHVTTLRQHTKKISSIIFTHGGKRMVTAGYDRLICVWNMENFTLIKKKEHSSNDGDHEDMIVGLAVDTAQSFIAVGFMLGNVGVYDIDFEQPILIFKAHDEKIMKIAISPFDGYISTGSADNNIKVWGLHDRPTLENTLEGHTNLVLALAFSPKSPILLTGSKDESVRGWDYKSNQELFTINAHKNTVFEISHHPSENAFISCSGEGLVCAWQYDQ